MKPTPGPYEIVTADLGDEVACIVPVGLKAANGKAIISYNEAMKMVNSVLKTLRDASAL